MQIVFLLGKRKGNTRIHREYPESFRIRFILIDVAVHMRNFPIGIIAWLALRNAGWKPGNSLHFANTRLHYRWYFGFTATKKFVLN